MPDVLGGREERVNRRLRSLAPSDRYTDKQTLMLLSTSVMGMIADIAAQLGAPASRSHPPLPSQNHLALPTDMASNIFMHHSLAKAKLPLVPFQFDTSASTHAPRSDLLLIHPLATAMTAFSLTPSLSHKYSTIKFA